MIPPHPWGLFFKVQSSNVVSLRDSINYLGPVVKPRDDKKGELCSAGPRPRDDKKDVIDITWVPWSSHGMTRKENCVVRGLGHGMTSFFLTFLFSKNNYKMKNNHKVN